MQIVVLDGSDVPSPEDLAMLQALYSRSPASVLEHLEKVRKAGSGKFMSQYYVGYGHRSIGDCGFVSMFVEQVSMLAAKAVQDTPLYCGQEASTRYLDMARQEVLNPLGTPEGAEVQAAWMAAYSQALSMLVPILKERYPRKPDEKEATWEKAIKAKAFDVARSLLPAGTTTLVAWSTNLRQAADHVIHDLMPHPLPEVGQVGMRLLETLKARYSSSFGHVSTPEQVAYWIQSMHRFAFFDQEVPDFSCEDRLDLAGLARHQDLLQSRPPRTELHHRLRRFGSLDFKFTLDFGSYRDLQRQRSVVQEMPLLTTRPGFHPWYAENLPPGTMETVASLARRVDALPCDPLVRQYYVPMGFRVPVAMSCPLPAAVYVAELRSGQTVHPTLRVRAQQMGEAIRAAVPGITMHHDMAPDEWSVRRGKQDIVQQAQA